MTSARLPDGFAVQLRRDVERLGGDRVLVGGSPLRALRLAPAAREVLHRGDGWRLEVHDEVSAVLARRLVDGNFADPDLVGQPTVNPDELTVVIPVCDRARQLDGALSSLDGLRCIVVDDASRGPSAVAAVAWRHGADLVHLAENVGPAGARNAGLRRVSTSYAAFVDSDVTVAGEVLLRLCRHFADPGVAVAGPVVRGRAPAGARWFERYDAADSSLDLGDRAASVRPGGTVGWLPSACLVGRVDVLGSSEVDGFDASLRVGEDVDLVWRLVASGWGVRYDPAERADHDTRASVRGWLGRKVVYGSGGAVLGLRHGDHVAPARLSVAMSVAGGALLLRRGWAAPVTAASLAWGARSLARALPSTPNSHRLALKLSVRGLGWAVRQESSLLLREWWPTAVLAACLSRTARRALMSAVVVDSCVALATTRPEVGPAIILLGRHLDDAAYGAGVWLGVLRHRSLIPLLPRGRVRGQSQSADPLLPSWRVRCGHGRHRPVGGKRDSLQNRALRKRLVTVLGEDRETHH